jgi:hypothetical protein
MSGCNSKGKAAYAKMMFGKLDRDIRMSFFGYDSKMIFDYEFKIEEIINKLQNMSEVRSKDPLEKMKGYVAFIRELNSEKQKVKSNGEKILEKLKNSNLSLEKANEEIEAVKKIMGKFDKYFDIEEYESMLELLSIVESNCINIPRVKAEILKSPEMPIPIATAVPIKPPEIPIATAVPIKPPEIPIATAVPIKPVQAISLPTATGILMKPCKKGYEYGPKGTCIVSCREDQFRNPETQRCKKKK